MKALNLIHLKFMYLGVTDYDFKGIERVAEFGMVYTNVLTNKFWNNGSNNYEK